MIGNLSCCPEAHQHTHTVGRQRDHTLRGALAALTGLGVGVNLSGHKEEVIADAMQGDAEEQHPRQIACIGVREQDIADRPSQHAHQQSPLHADAHQAKGDQQHEQHLGHLAQGLLSGCVGQVNLREEQVGVLVIESQWNADQDRGDEEHQEVAILQQGERVQPQHVPYRHALSGLHPGRCLWQREAVQTEYQGGRGTHRECVLEHTAGECRRSIPGESVADDQTGDDPAHRPPQPDF